MTVRKALVPALVLAIAGAAQAAERIADNELQRAPSPARIASIVDESSKQGWGVWIGHLRDAAFRAYQSNSGETRAWYYLYRWAAMLATPERIAINRWIEAVNRASVGHPNMAASYPSSAGSLSARISPELQTFALGSAEFSEEFFATIKEVDNPVALLVILQVLYGENPALFEQYGSLALAIAVVYDVPPPPIWPHGQVPDEVLQRRWHSPLEAFRYWTKLDRARGSLHRLARLPAAELKFVIDTGTPFVELDWAKQNVALALGEFSKAYDMVRYRKDRLDRNQFDWPGADYEMQTIRSDGGICVDQAYFATTAGKARGVPTLLFRGAGLDGRHAWFGYLASDGWKLDCGRYAEQRYVVGLALDPQTWMNLTDHELLFMSERFRALPLFRLSELHSAFAGEFARNGDLKSARAAAREAVNRDRRNVAGWRTLIAIEEAAGDDPRTREATMREAMLAFQRYPDLEAEFARKIINSLRSRGETSLAEVEERQLAKKYQGGRSDLSIKQAAEMVRRSIGTDDLATRIRVFDGVLRNYGYGAGTDFYDRVVVPFIDHLKAIGQIPIALQLLDRARRTLRVESGSMLEREMDALETRLKKGGA